MGKSQPIPITFGHQTDTGRYGYETGPYHLNAYVQQVKESRSQYPIYACDGFNLLGTVTDGSDCRGALEFDATTGYIMSGSTVNKIEYDGSSFTSTIIGGITSTGQAIMARNQASPAQVVIVVDNQAYYVADDVLAEITDTDLPEPVSCTFLNQRILYGIEDGRTFYSDVNDATAIGAASFFTASGSSDKLVRGIEHLQEYWAFGERTTEIWVNTSSTTAPFRRNAGALIPKGCAARHSIVKLDNDIFWVGDDFSVYMARGHSWQKISNQTIEKDIGDLSDKSSITAFGYFTRGNGFYTLNSGSWSWQYNVATGAWFPRKSTGINRWSAHHHLLLNQKNVVGDYATGKMYALDENTYTENGETLPVILRSPPVGDFPNQYVMDRLFLDFMPGIGLNSTNEYERNPKVGLRYSDDLGKNWSNQRFRDLGSLGAYGTRVDFQNLGVTGEAGRILEVEISAPSKRVLVGASFQGEKLTR